MSLILAHSILEKLKAIIAKKAVEGGEYPHKGPFEDFGALMHATADVVNGVTDITALTVLKNLFESQIDKVEYNKWGVPIETGKIWEGLNQCTLRSLRSIMMYRIVELNDQ